MNAITFVVAFCASLASAGVVITPISKDFVVPKVEGDCFFGVSTPTGCGPLRE
ncbi:putative secreted protein [Rosellinia necatrix]|uniref:Putative secreted protein n=1 Tax=Rosellinia necatrix TaxID=77044 RepID=A0A1S8A7T7_ROSNE|nr:putative secreted protein [Rosellinia necatrix]